jgi:penicillin-binding protein 1C
MGRIIGLIFKLAGGLIASAIVIGVGIFSVFYVFYSLPEPLSKPFSSFQILDREETPLRSAPNEAHEHHRWVLLDAISPWLIKATLAAEDKRFYSHWGIDPIAMMRAAFQWKEKGQIISGASTITQQVIKIHENRPRTFKTKIREVILAIKLERQWTKKQILETYLNRLDYGNLRIGIAAAAHLYFNQTPATLTPSQSAFLAGLPNAPSLLNPYRPQGYERAIRRRNVILHRMLRFKMMDQETYKRALEEPIEIRPRQTSFQAPHFEDYILKTLQNHSSSVATSLQNDLKTTLDLKLNRFVQSTVARHLSTLSTRNVKHAAVIILENNTGHLLSMVGSPNYFCEQSGQVNGTLALRSPGSALKPFIYALALENGFHPASILPDVPLNFRSAYGNYQPKNYTGKTQGPVLLAEALGNSQNIPAVYLLNELGGPGLLLRKLQEMGITTLTASPDDYGLGLTIGTGEVNLLELTNAYAALARLGLWKPISIFPNIPPCQEPRQVFHPTTAHLISLILSDPENRRLTFGHAPSLEFPFPVACKTGTSTNYRDNWCLGYTPEFTVGVWVGNFDNTPMRNVTGLSGAAPIFHEIFHYLHRHYTTTWYPPSPQIISMCVDAWTGTFPCASTQKTRTLFFSKNRLPWPSENFSYHPKTGQLLLPSIYSSWLASHENYFGSQAAVMDADTAIKILNPIPGTVYILDPDLPPSSREIRVDLATPRSPSFTAHATSPTLSGSNDPLTFKLTPGTHKIYVHTPQKVLHTWIEVREE